MQLDMTTGIKRCIKIRNCMSTKVSPFVIFNNTDCVNLCKSIYYMHVQCALSTSHFRTTRVHVVEICPALHLPRPLEITFSLPHDWPHPHQHLLQHHQVLPARHHPVCGKEARVGMAGGHRDKKGHKLPYYAGEGDVHLHSAQGHAVH